MYITRGLLCAMVEKYNKIIRRDVDKDLQAHG
jgi:hypothetical protein